MRSELQNEYVTKDNGSVLGCENCGAVVLFDSDNVCLIFTCNCGEVDAENVPEWLKGELS